MISKRDLRKHDFWVEYRGGTRKVTLVEYFKIDLMFLLEKAKKFFENFLVTSAGEVRRKYLEILVNAFALTLFHVLL